MSDKTCRFVQVIDEKRYEVEIPESRVDSIIGRVDLWIDRKKYARALQVLEPFVTDGKAEPKKEVEVPKVKAKNHIVAFIEEHRAKGKYAVMQLLQSEKGLNKHQAYYQTKKAGLQ